MPRLEKFALYPEPKPHILPIFDAEKAKLRKSFQAIVKSSRTLTGRDDSIATPKFSDVAEYFTDTVALIDNAIKTAFPNTRPIYVIDVRKLGWGTPNTLGVFYYYIPGMDTIMVNDAQSNMIRVTYGKKFWNISNPSPAHPTNLTEVQRFMEYLFLLDSGQ